MAFPAYHVAALQYFNKFIKEQISTASLFVSGKSAYAFTILGRELLI